MNLNLFVSSDSAIDPSRPAEEIRSMKTCFYLQKRNPMRESSVFERLHSTWIYYELVLENFYRMGDAKFIPK